MIKKFNGKIPFKLDEFLTLKMPESSEMPKNYKVAIIKASLFQFLAA